MLATHRMEKEFALLLAAMAAAVAVWPLFTGGPLAWPWLLLALSVLALAWCAPRLLTPLAQAWQRLAHLLGLVNTGLLLALVFFLVITPVALLFRLRGRDALRLKRIRASSYWLEQKKEWPPESFREQF